MEVLVLFSSLQSIVILSKILVVHAGVKSTNVTCPHNTIVVQSIDVFKV